ncbi:DJ-1/PfpI family protein [Chitinasiproducens palmae]|uniref:Cyclohexyl-isocyanide hydratase n=1 Tax=Chitinasiproducens palmae TaxID=1770053 RepID=A0A1H2PLV0_9BURK|nr:DJ-1/PfpI family protein [Chitinasiproducens palmae]SDV47068.1 cyclohexyl-isocyanide hydratase [Chitinasiproducens palmae]
MSQNAPLVIGSLAFDGIDQIDLTGPFEVLSRLPGATHRIYARSTDPVRDVHGLRIVPDATLDDAPRLDVLHVPGGPGQEALMHDEVVLQWLRQQSAGARRVLSVCTGALVLGAAGLLRGRRATTHWNSFHLLPCFGAEAVDQRVVVDGKWIFAAGVTAGIDGALRLAADMLGDTVAQSIQLGMAYAPEPPFDSGTPATAPASVLAAARAAAAELTARREATARTVAARLGIGS